MTAKRIRFDEDARRELRHGVDVLANAVDVAAPLLEDKRHRLEIEVAKGGLLVDGDPDRMAQAFGGILSNAA